MRPALRRHGTDGLPWVQAVRPAVAIASTAGDSNSHGHPNGEVFLRIADFAETLSSEHAVHWCAGKRHCGTAKTNEAIFSTSHAGTLVLRTDGTTWRIDCSTHNAC